MHCSNDQQVQDDLFDEYRRFLESKFLPAVPPDFPNSKELEYPEVLDCGCGTGGWIDYLMEPGLDADDDDKYPEAVVSPFKKIEIQ